MSDDKYFCSVCKEPTQPTLCEVGPSASCCREAALAVRDEEREPLFAAELVFTSVRAWQAGMDYGDLHTYFASPSPMCECDACDRGREWERAAERLDDECPTWDTPPLRPLTDSEIETLTESLLDDSGDRRAYQRHWES